MMIGLIKISKEIPLTRGEFAIVDDEDFEWLSQWKWRYHHNGYAVRLGSTVNGKREFISMHRLILNVPKDKVTDHINGNRLDNRKCNLRTCTVKENNRNCISRIGISKYKGLVYNSKNNTWDVKIRYNNKDYYCGCYNDELVAANVYNFYAIMLHKEFAKINDVVHIDPKDFNKYRVKKGNNKYHGVTYNKSAQKWFARITVSKNKRIFIGQYSTEIEAVIAYNNMVIELFGLCPKLHIIKGYDSFEMDTEKS